MRPGDFDRLLLQGIFQGLSVEELAARIGMSPAWVEVRTRIILRTVSMAQPRKQPSPTVEHIRLAALLHLWNARRGAMPLPPYGTLGLTDLQPWIEHTAVMELKGAPPQPRIRLLGRKAIQYMRGDKRGLYLVDFIPEDVHSLALEPYRRCAEQRLPQYDVLGSAFPGCESLRYHRLLLPHGLNGDRVEIVLISCYVEADGTEPKELPNGFYDLQPRKAG